MTSDVYRVSASATGTGWSAELKNALVSVQFGQRRPSESGTPIELGDGQTLDKIRIALPRGSVLGGRITDEFGEPVANASVTAFRYAYAGGTRLMTPARCASCRRWCARIRRATRPGA